MNKILSVFIFSIPVIFTAAAQTPHGWHLLDYEKDSLYGAGITRAYRELLSYKTPAPVIVAVIDGGIDTAHEDLQSILWNNPGEQNGNIDHDHNGYAGDVHGWNFLGHGDKQVIKESYEYVRFYLRHRERFENISPEQIKTKDRYLYKQWLVSKALWLQYKDFLYPADTVLAVYRDSVMQDNYYRVKDRYYGNNNLTGKPYDHGTHVAGIIAASHDNGKGMDGVANAVSIMAIRAVPNGDEHDKDIAVAIRYAVDNGAQIINMSFGKATSPYRRFVDEALQYAERKGVLIVRAAGNEGKNIDSIPYYPWPFYNKRHQHAENFICVGLSNSAKNNLVVPYSNYGKNTVDIFAPGVQIYSTVPGNKYAAMDGTSMAAPVVTGVAAMLKSYFPELTAREIRNIILSSARKINFPVVLPSREGQMVSMKSLCISGGILDGYAAIKMAIQFTQQSK